MQTLGEARRGSPPRASRRRSDLRGKLDAIAKRSQGRTVADADRPRTIAAAASRGADNYLDDVLTLRGGRNVIRASPIPYPSIDREC
jgi:hypothetical protein